MYGSQTFLCFRKNRLRFPEPKLRFPSKILAKPAKNSLARTLLLRDYYPTTKESKMDNKPVMEHSINLWECLTRLESLNKKDFQPIKVTEEDLIALGRNTRTWHQELSLQSTAEGWVIRIFSCEPDCYGDEAVILIPSDHKEPIKVLKDRIGRITFSHE